VAGNACGWAFPLTLRSASASQLLEIVLEPEMFFQKNICLLGGVSNMLIVTSLGLKFDLNFSVENSQYRTVDSHNLCSIEVDAGWSLRRIDPDKRHIFPSTSFHNRLAQRQAPGN
jgi:hypothetical protein